MPLLRLPNSLADASTNMAIDAALLKSYQQKSHSFVTTLGRSPPSLLDTLKSG